MKAPKIKKLANGGETPKFKSQAEFDKYYTSKGYKVDPTYKAGTRYYNPNDLDFNTSLQKFSGKGMGQNIGEGNPEAKYFVEFNPQNTIATATPVKAIVEDSGRKPLFTGNQYYDAFQYPDPNAGYSQSTTKYFDKKTGAEVDPSKSFSDDGKKYTPYLKSYNKGGVIKKIKGYAGGGGVDAGWFNSQTLGSMSQGGDMIADKLQEDATNYNGTVHEGEYALAGAQREANKGAQIGMSTGGPWGAAIGAAAGGIKGGIQSYLQAKNINEGIAYGERMNEAEKARQEQASKFNTSLQQQMLERQQGLAKGGVVKGKGGPKDDSIKAKVAPKSFIVPAENAHVAKEVKKMIAPSKKKDDVANLNQGGGVEVKLSNGEFMFTPEEREEIIQELGEEFLEALAPNAEDEDEGMREGGLTPYKAKKMLKDGKANGVDLTDKQRAYMGLVASGYKCGGMVKGYAKGGEVPKTKGQKSTYRNMAVTYDGKNWVTDDGNIKYSADVLDDVLKKQYDKEAKDEANYQAQKKNALKRHYDKIKDDPSRKVEADKLYNQLNPSKSTIPTKTGAEIEKITSTKTTPTSKTKVSESIKFVPPTGETSETEIPKVGPKYKMPSSQELLDDPENKYGESMLSQTARAELAKKDTKEKGFDYSKGLGLLGDAARGFGNYILPFQQYKMGTQFLAEAGKRPQYQIDRDFLKSVTTAQANAQFGFTPEEKAIIDSRNLNALRAAQGAAQNYSGGSGATALNIMRQAGGDYYNRGLQSALANKNLQMSKQQQANSLIADKAAMNRQIFQDNLNAWQQNQAAGQNLVGMGLQNMIGAKRLNDEMQFQRKYQQGNNPYSDNYANSLTNYTG